MVSVTCVNVTWHGVRWSKADKVRETVRTYTQRLPVPRGARPGAQLQERRTEDEVAEEILELKRALNTARHDLQIEKVRSRRRESTVGKHKLKGWHLIV